MQDAVSQALYGRGREPQGLSRMVAISGALHIALAAFLALVPATWLSRAPEAPREVMRISLNSAPGPKSGGLTPISARPVQRAVEEMPKVQPTRAPAAKTPEMVVPEEKPRVTPKPTTPVKEAPKEARSRQPTVGKEQLQGKAMAETGSVSNTMGLSTSGMAGTGEPTNFGNFCCPEYIGDMIARINQNWNSRQPNAGITTMRFTIQRDGTLTDIQVARSSGNQMLDFLAQRALLAVRQLPPLPPAYTNPNLIVDLHFEYQR